MKRFCLLILLIFITSGCGTKHITCKSDGIANDLNATTKIEAEIKNNKVVNATATITYLDVETAKSMCSIFKLAQDAENKVTCDEYNIYISDYHKSLSDEELNKEQFINKLEEQNIKCN